MSIAAAGHNFVLAFSTEEMHAFEQHCAWEHRSAVQQTQVHSMCHACIGTWAGERGLCRCARHHDRGGFLPDGAGQGLWQGQGQGCSPCSHLLAPAGRGH